MKLIRYLVTLTVYYIITSDSMGKCNYWQWLPIPFDSVSEQTNVLTLIASVFGKSLMRCSLYRTRFMKACYM